MEKANIIIRYQCDGCNQIFADRGSLTEIVIKQLRGSMLGSGELEVTDRYALSCKACLRDEGPAGRVRQVGFRAPDND